MPSRPPTLFTAFRQAAAGFLAVFACLFALGVGARWLGPASAQAPPPGSGSGAATAGGAGEEPAGAVVDAAREVTTSVVVDGARTAGQDLGASVTAMAVDAPTDLPADSDEGPVLRAAPEEAVQPHSLGSSEPDSSPFYLRIVSGLGILAFIGIGWLMSSHRKKVNWQLVGSGVLLQLTFAILILKTPIGKPFFNALARVFTGVISFTDAGKNLLFGSYVDNGTVHPALINFTFAILPTIIFFSSLMTVLYHMGIMQRVVGGVAWVMQRTMRTSGSETLSAAANIFVGQTEAPLMVKPFVNDMTLSELHAIMVGGFATVAGGVMAIYIQFLTPHFPDIAGHLMAASVMSAPAALVMAKLMLPEVEESKTAGGAPIVVQKLDANVIDAAARGAGEGMQLALNVAAMLLAFVAFIAMLDYLVALPAYIQHGLALDALLEQIRSSGLVLPADLAATCDPAATDVATDARAGCIEQIRAAVAGAPEVSVWKAYKLSDLFGYAFWPLAFLMGAPPEDCLLLGRLLGEKTVINEFVAYVTLSGMLADPEIHLSSRSVVIATYALCGFSNFGSIAIQIGGIGSIAPGRRGDLARLGLKAMVAGSFACFMTAAVAGMII